MLSKTQQQTLVHCSTLLKKHICLMQNLREQLLSNSESDSSQESIDSEMSSNSDFLNVHYTTLNGALDPYSPLYDLWENWKTKICKIVLKSKDQILRQKFASLIRLIGCLFMLLGEPILSLESFVYCMSLFPSNILSWIFAVHLSCRLGFWDLAREIVDLRKNQFSDEKLKYIDSFCFSFVKLHQIWIEIHLSTKVEFSSIVEQITEIANSCEIKKTYSVYRTHSLCHEIMADAAKLPFSSKDPLCSLELSVYGWRAVLRSHFPDKNSEKPVPTDFTEKALTQTESFAEICFDIFNWFESFDIVANGYIESGLPRQASAYLLEGIQFAKKLGYVNWITRFTEASLRLNCKLQDEIKIKVYREWLESLGKSENSLQESNSDEEVKSKPYFTQLKRNSSTDSDNCDISVVSSQRRSSRLKSKAMSISSNSTSVVEDSFEVEHSSIHPTRRSSRSTNKPCSSISSVDGCKLLDISEESSVFLPSPSFEIPTSSSLCHKSECICWLCKLSDQSPSSQVELCKAQVALIGCQENQPINGQIRQEMWKKMQKTKDGFIKSLENAVESVCEAVNVRNCFRVKFSTPLFRFLIPYLLEWAESSSDRTERGQWAERALKLSENDPVTGRYCYLMANLWSSITKLRSSDGLELESDLLKGNASTGDLADQLGRMSLKSAKKKVPSMNKRWKQARQTTVMELKKDFERFAYLLYHPWRRLICETLSSMEWQNNKDPSLIAWYLSETESLNLRLRSRLLPIEKKRLHKTMNDTLVDFKDRNDFRRAAMELPKGWTVVHLHLSSQPIGRYLWITRLKSDSKPLALPICRFSHEHEKLLKRFELVLRENEDSTKLSVAKHFWEERRRLDSLLKELTDLVEKKWLGILRPLLLGSMNIRKNDIIWQECYMKLENLEWTSSLIEILQNAALCLSILDLSKLIDLLGVGKSIETLTVTKAILERFSLVANFKKVDIEREPVVLVLSQELSIIPWECMSFLSENCQSALCRVPSFHYCIGCLRQLKIVPKQVDATKTYYVLDPGNDLSNTNQTLGPLFQNLNWPGLSGNKPANNEVMKALEEQELFIYCGHGSGMRYVTSSTVRHADCKAVALLFGCSSARQKSDGGHFEARGVIHEYFIASCPCVVGCLWVITDRDIDKFCMALLTSWLHLSTSQDKTEFTKHLLIAISKARKVCKLPYLTGAACVAYGLPVISK